MICTFSLAVLYTSSGHLPSYSCTYICTSWLYSCLLYNTWKSSFIKHTNLDTLFRLKSPNSSFFYNCKYIPLNGIYSLTTFFILNAPWPLFTLEYYLILGHLSSFYIPGGFPRLFCILLVYALAYCIVLT
jgi:hypothetical protein